VAWAIFHFFGNACLDPAEQHVDGTAFELRLDHYVSGEQALTGSGQPQVNVV